MNGRVETPTDPRHLKPRGHEMNFRATRGESAVPITIFMQIDAACDLFEDECRAGQSPDLASYLADVPSDAREPLFRNLLKLDFEYRQLRGERPDARRYRE